MEEKLFKNNNFGDKFTTRNNKVVLFINSTNKKVLVVDQKGCKYFVDINGRRYTDTEDEMDIVSKYNVPITPEEINDECERIYHEGGFDIPEEVFCLNINCTYTDFRWGFEQGYQAAWKKLTGKDLVYSKDDKENK